MREIKFRGKCISNGQWVYGDLFYDMYKSANVIRETHATCYQDEGPAEEQKNYEVYIDSIGQFLGKQFNSDLELYEWDILSFDIQDYNGGDHLYTSVIEYMGSEFICKTDKDENIYATASVDWILSQDDEARGKVTHIHHL